MNNQSTDSISKSIIQTLLYFDVFKYPLKANEVYRFLQSNHVTPEIIQKKLHQLAKVGLAFRFGDYFALHNDAALINRRVKGNNEAEQYLHLANNQALLIQQFPFVKAVMASGSLSKGYMDDSSDLDFFIVTQANRLWIARTLLVLYKRIFLANSHKYFCVNYFVDENNLEIEEKNLYTATELTTLIPLTGHGYQEKLLSANKWIQNCLPNAKYKKRHEPKRSEHGFVKRILESVFNILFPKVLNLIFMKITHHRWKKLYMSKYSAEDFRIAFKTKPNVSKNHPNFYQKQVMELYSTKRADFANRNQLKWDL